MAERGVTRKCRSEACAKWSEFPKDDPARACTFCGAEYGKITLGLDVILTTSTSKYPGGKASKAQTQATSVPRPKPGEFGGGRVRA
jgi:hypothetical protein